MNPIFKIISFTRHFWKWYLIMAFFIIAVSLLSLAGPLLSKQIVDIIVAKVTLKTVDLSRLYWILGFIFFADILISVLNAIGQWIGDLFTVRLQTYLSTKFYEHILNLNIGYYDNEIAGRIVNKLYRGISSIVDFVKNMLNNFLPFFLTALVTIFLLAHFSLIIALLLAALFPLYILISHKSSSSWQNYQGKINVINDESQGRVFESITGIRIVKAFAAEVHELFTYVTSRGKIEKITHIQTKEWHWYDFMRRFALNIILFGIYTYVIYWTFYGRFTIGEMTLLLQLVNQARFPLFAMSFILGQIQEASAGSADFFKVLQTKTAVNDKPGAKQLVIHSLKSKKPLVIFKNVSFSYESKKTILTNINFNIYPNEKLALVGESGQGKSTLVNLLLRYYELQKGSITVQGVNIEDVTQDSLHKNVAVVFQESLLFSGTIIENIRYGKPDATDNQVHEAAQAANAHEFILKLDNGYNSLIGERGVKLSGGQKQRIAIARAILKDAPIIILDEATSSLDTKSELEVQKGLERLLKGRTSIIIAHRLSTIANADHLLVLEKGTVSQYGSSKELLNDKNGLYYQLVNLQQQLLTMPSEERSKKLSQFDLVG